MQISIHRTFYFHAQKKVAGASGTNPMPWPLPALNLRAYFRPIAEGEHHSAVRIYRCVIHKPVEQLLVEIHRQLLRFAKPRKEAAKNVIQDFLPLPLFSQAVHPALKCGVPAGIYPSYFLR